MSESETGPHRLKFGVFDLDVSAGELLKAGRRIAIAGQPLKVLEILASRPGILVTRAELQRELWADDTVVDFEQNLNSAVRRLRDALGDSAETPIFIETLPRRGYRFVAPVEIERATNQAVADVPRSQSRNWTNAALLTIGLGCGVLAALAWSWADRSNPGRQVRSIAVLPFVSLSSEPDHEFLVDGVTEALTKELSSIAALRVTSRTSTLPYRGTIKTIPQVTSELGVDAVIEGSVQSEGDRIRVTVQLIDGTTDSHLWANAYERRLDGVLDLQADIARTIAGEIRITVTPLPEQAAAAVSPEAMRLYLRGQYHLNRHTRADFLQALECFDQALALAPAYAPIYESIALAWEEQSSWHSFVTPREGFPRAKAAAQQALALDPALSNPYVTLAFVAETLEGDGEAAERGYQKALELNPSNARAARHYALYLRRRGRFDASLQQARRARDVDPMSLEANVEYGVQLMGNGMIDESIAQLERTRLLHPDQFDPHTHLSEAYVIQRRFPQALAAARTGVEMSKGNAHAVNALISALIAAGDTEEARKQLEDLERRPVQRDALAIATLRLQLGDTELGLNWLERACQERPPQFAYFAAMARQPIYDPIRQNPRFALLSQCASPQQTP